MLSGSGPLLSPRDLSFPICQWWGEAFHGSATSVWGPWRPFPPGPAPLRKHHLSSPWPPQSPFRGRPELHSGLAFITCSLPGSADEGGSPSSSPAALSPPFLGRVQGMEGSQPRLAVSLWERLPGCVSSCSWGSLGRAVSPVSPDRRNGREAHSHSPYSVLDGLLCFPSPHSQVRRPSHSPTWGGLCLVLKARHPSDSVRYAPVLDSSPGIWLVFNKFFFPK